MRVTLFLFPYGIQPNKGDTIPKCITPVQRTEHSIKENKAHKGNQHSMELAKNMNQENKKNKNGVPMKSQESLTNNEVHSFYPEAPIKPQHKMCTKAGDMETLRPTSCINDKNLRLNQIRRITVGLLLVSWVCNLIKPTGHPIVFSNGSKNFNSHFQNCCGISTVDKPTFL